MSIWKPYTEEEKKNKQYLPLEEIVKSPPDTPSFTHPLSTLFEALDMALENLPPLPEKNPHDH